MGERDIPPAALSNLEGLAKADFKGNLGKIIHDIYQTAHTMFSDMPQGPQEARQIQVRLEDAEENPTRTLQGRCRRTYCEEDNHAGSVRDPREMYLETGVIIPKISFKL